MFEDSTFETMGRIHTRSRGWMIATFALNSSILLALIFIPLIYPEALPRIANAILVLAPPAPVEEPAPVPRAQHAAASQTEIFDGRIQAPPTISRDIYIPTTQEQPGYINSASLAGDSGPGTGGPRGPFNGTGPVVRQAVVQTQRVPSRLTEGMLIHKVIPTYPPIGIASRQSGTVVLEATISRTGTIENLRVVSGPPMLRQAALDAVSQWRYRPYLLNGQPVEVETTVNVEFTLD